MSDNGTSVEATPAMPHLAAEFFVWLWFTSEQEGGTIDVGGEVGPVDVWVDSRLSFRAVDEDKARAVMTGENPATTLEARAALAGGKVVNDIRIALRREEREYSVTLKGPHFDLNNAKLPAEIKTGEDEMLYERMYLVDELWFVLKGLYVRFATERTEEAWKQQRLPAIRQWAAAAALA